MQTSAKKINLFLNPLYHQISFFGVRFRSIFRFFFLLLHFFFSTFFHYFSFGRMIYTRRRFDAQYFSIRIYLDCKREHLSLCDAFFVSIVRWLSEKKWKIAFVLRRLFTTNPLWIESRIKYIFLWCLLYNIGIRFFVKLYYSTFQSFSNKSIQYQSAVKCIIIFYIVNFIWFLLNLIQFR